MSFQPEQFCAGCASWVDWLSDDDDRCAACSAGVIETRWCGHLQHWQPVELFGSHRWCKPCHAAYQRDHYRLKAAA